MKHQIYHKKQARKFISPQVKVLLFFGVIVTSFVGLIYLAATHTPETETNKPSAVAGAQTEQKNSNGITFIRQSFAGNEVAQAKVTEHLSDDASIQLSDARGILVDTPITQKQSDSGTDISITPPASFKPGIYTLKVKDAKGTVLEQNFTWGVLAINPEKSIYTPKEHAHLSLAVLDETGFMVCNARLSLTISHVNSDGKEVKDVLTTDNNTIVRNPECIIKDYVEKPDYETIYTVDNAGEYQMDLVAVTPNGTYSIHDTFLVKDSVPFSVQRIMNTRIYPIKTYPVQIKITANQNFNGYISESVPASYVVSKLEPDDQDFITSQAGDRLYLSWRLNLKKGQSKTLRYRYKAPTLSPQFHLLGPIKFLSGNTEVFQENRMWQIAVDAQTTIDNATSADGFMHNNIHDLVFTSSSNGYFFYVDSDGRCGYSKSTDGGSSWGAQVDIGTSTQCRNLSVWYDQWTPGDSTGTKIYIAYMIDGGGTNAKVHYAQLDTSSDTLTTVGQVSTTQNSWVDTGNGNKPGIVKATNNQLYIGWHDNNGTDPSNVISCTATCTTAGNWFYTNMTIINNSVTDELTFVPLRDGRVMLIRFADSANTFDYSFYTPGSDTWTAFSNITSGVNSVSYNLQWSVIQNPRTSDIYLAYVDGTNIETITYSTNAGTWSAKTDIVTGVTTAGQIKLFLELNVGSGKSAIYAAYIANTGSGVNVYYKVSTDFMSTWGSQQGPINTSGTVTYGLQTNTFSNSRIYVTWNDDSADDLFGDTITTLSASAGFQLESVKLNGVKFN